MHGWKKKKKKQSSVRQSLPRFCGKAGACPMPKNSSHPRLKTCRPRLTPAASSIAQLPPGIGHNQPPVPIDGPLLVTRKQAGHLLNVSASTLIRMENTGVLRAVKLTRGRSAQTYYSRASIVALAERGAGDAR
jgi:hypothetical protein